MGIPITVIGEGKASYNLWNISVAIVELYQSYLILISDQEKYGIGTVTLSSPPVLEGTGVMNAPFPIFGLKNTMLAGIVGKMAGQKLKHPVLSLLFIKETNLKAEIIMKTVVDALQQALENIELQQKNKSK